VSSWRRAPLFGFWFSLLLIGNKDILIEDKN